jgi:hypothetical protein
VPSEQASRECIKPLGLLQLHPVPCRLHNTGFICASDDILRHTLFACRLFLCSQLSALSLSGTEGDSVDIRNKWWRLNKAAEKGRCKDEARPIPSTDRDYAPFVAIARGQHD